MNYDPNYHKSVVDNLRQMFKEKFNINCCLCSDKEIWNIFEENANIEDADKWNVEDMKSKHDQLSQSL